MSEYEDRYGDTPRPPPPPSIDIVPWGGMPTFTPTRDNSASSSFGTQPSFSSFRQPNIDANVAVNMPSISSANTSFVNSSPILKASFEAAKPDLSANNLFNTPPVASVSQVQLKNTGIPSSPKVGGGTPTLSESVNMFMADVPAPTQKLTSNFSELNNPPSQPPPIISSRPDYDTKNLDELVKNMPPLPNGTPTLPSNTQFKEALPDTSDFKEMPFSPEKVSPNGLIQSVPNLATTVQALPTSVTTPPTTPKNLTRNIDTINGAAIPTKKINESYISPIDSSAISNPNVVGTPVGGLSPLTTIPSTISPALQPIAPLETIEQVTPTTTIPGSTIKAPPAPTFEENKQKVLDRPPSTIPNPITVPGAPIPNGVLGERTDISGGGTSAPIPKPSVVSVTDDGQLASISNNPPEGIVQKPFNKAGFDENTQNITPTEAVQVPPPPKVTSLPVTNTNLPLQGVDLAGVEALDGGGLGSGGEPKLPTNPNIDSGSEDSTTTSPDSPSSNKLPVNLPPTNVTSNDFGGGAPGTIIPTIPPANAKKIAAEIPPRPGNPENPGTTDSQKVTTITPTDIGDNNTKHAQPGNQVEREVPPNVSNLEKVELTEEPPATKAGIVPADSQVPAKKPPAQPPPENQPPVDNSTSIEDLQEESANNLHNNDEGEIDLNQQVIKKIEKPDPPQPDTGDDTGSDTGSGTGDDTGSGTGDDTGGDTTGDFIDNKTKDLLDKAQDTAKETTENDSDGGQADSAVGEIKEKIEDKLKDEAVKKEEKNKSGNDKPGEEECPEGGDGEDPKKEGEGEGEGEGDGNTQQPGDELGLDAEVVSEVVEDAIDEEGGTSKEAGESETPNAVDSEGDAGSNEADGPQNIVTMPDIYVVKASEIGELSPGFNFNFTSTYESSLKSTNQELQEGVLNWSSTGGFKSNTAESFIGLDGEGLANVELNPNGDMDIHFSFKDSVLKTMEHTRTDRWVHDPDAVGVDSQSGPMYKYAGSEFDTKDHDYKQFEAELAVRAYAGDEGEMFGHDYDDKIGMMVRYSQGEIGGNPSEGHRSFLDDVGIKDYKNFEFAMTYSAVDMDLGDALLSPITVPATLITKGYNQSKRGFSRTVDGINDFADDVANDGVIPALTDLGKEKFLGVARFGLELFLGNQ